MFYKLRRKKLIQRFIELDNKRQELENNGCLKRSCCECKLLIRINEHYSTCDHCIYGEEMLNIYKKLFPKDDEHRLTWNQKVKRVRDL